MELTRLVLEVPLYVTQTRRKDVLVDFVLSAVYTQLDYVSILNI